MSGDGVEHLTGKQAKRKDMLTLDYIRKLSADGGVVCLAAVACVAAISDRGLL